MLKSLNVLCQESGHEKNYFFWAISSYVGRTLFASTFTALFFKFSLSLCATKKYIEFYIFDFWNLEIFMFLFIVASETCSFIAISFCLILDFAFNKFKVSFKIS